MGNAPLRLHPWRVATRRQKPPGMLEKSVTICENTCGRSPRFAHDGAATAPVARTHYPTADFARFPAKTRWRRGGRAETVASSSVASSGAMRVPRSADTTWDRLQIVAQNGTQASSGRRTPARRHHHRSRGALQQITFQDVQEHCPARSGSWPRAGSERRRRRATGRGSRRVPPARSQRWAQSPGTRMRGAVSVSKTSGADPRSRRGRAPA